MQIFQESALCTASLGHWRVVGADGLKGRLVRVIGDYDSFSVATDVEREAQYPHRREVYDDLGRKISGFMPGVKNDSEAGIES